MTPVQADAAHQATECDADGLLSWRLPFSALPQDVVIGIRGVVAFQEREPHAGADIIARIDTSQRLALRELRVSSQIAEKTTKREPAGRQHSQHPPPTPTAHSDDAADGGRRLQNDAEPATGIEKVEAVGLKAVVPNGFAPDQQNGVRDAPPVERPSLRIALRHDDYYRGDQCF